MRTTSLTDANVGRGCRPFIARARPFFSFTAADRLVKPAATPAFPDVALTQLELDSGAFGKTGPASSPPTPERDRVPWEWRDALNGSDQLRLAPALKELYSKPRRSKAWDSEEAEAVRFWTDDGDSWGFLFHHLPAIHYSARHERLLITWTLGTVVIAGPKVLEFYEDFCSHRATSLKSDGKDILAVKMVLNAESDVDAPSPNL